MAEFAITTCQLWGADAGRRPIRRIMRGGIRHFVRADHMETVEFKQGLEQLAELARKNRTAVMCAEALWWRCHRSLIADYLKTLGATVIHVSDEKQGQIHPYTAAARVVQGRLSYEGLFSIIFGLSLMLSKFAGWTGG